MNEKSAEQKSDLTSVIFHGFYPGSPDCPECGASPSEHEVKNYNEMFRDGDVHCKKCGAYVRAYDAG